MLVSLSLLLTACDKEPSIAVVDADVIINASPHAKQANSQLIQIQEIYQYNLNVIEKKFATYKNQPQTQIWLREALQKLQSEMNTTRTAIGQAMATTMLKEIELVRVEKEYEMIIAKGSILANDAAMDITPTIQQRFNDSVVVWPSLPIRNDNPDLPADVEIVQPAPAPAAQP